MSDARDIERSAPADVQAAVVPPDSQAAPTGADAVSAAVAAERERIVGIIERYAARHGLFREDAPYDYVNAEFELIDLVRGGA